jgi:hypothetical protein
MADSSGVSRNEIPGARALSLGVFGLPALDALINNLRITTINVDRILFFVLQQCPDKSKDYGKQSSI